MVYKPKGRRFYLVEFHHRGKRICKRTKVTHIDDARAIENAIRTELERGNYGILKPKPVPSLAEFLKGDFLPYNESRFRQSKPNTAIYYQYGAKLLLGSPLAHLRFDTITSREVGQFIACNAHRSPSTTNKGLETLRRALNLANEWGRLGRKLRIALAKGTRQRTRVLSQDEAQDYLAACAQPWRDVATLILGTGMRLGECCALKWEHILMGDDNGLIQVAEGKRKAARRLLPMVPDVLNMMKARHNAQGCPKEGWVFPTMSGSGHLGRYTYGKKHRTALAMIAKAHEMMPSIPAVAPFEPYCLRHTALTRLAPHADAYTLAQIAGHESIAMTMRYVHPQAEAIEKAFKGMAGLPTKEPTKAGGKR